MIETHVPVSLLRGDRKQTTSCSGDVMDAHRPTVTARDAVLPGARPLVLRTYTGALRSRQMGRVRIPAERRARRIRADPCLGSGEPAPRLTLHGCVPTVTSRATPSLWSPFLRVGARTLRTEQCAKSQCVYPVEHGRCGSPCLPARRSYGNCNTGRPIRVCCSVRPTFQQRTRNRPSRAGSNGSSTESLILAQDERWRRA